jgi:adenylate cyclase class 2
MQKEIEAKFAQADHDAVRAKLKAAGAECTYPMRTMVRAILDYPDRRLQKDGGWIRVRNEGDKTILTYKQVAKYSAHGVREINVTVDSYDQTVAFLLQIGMFKQSEQETRRETWELDGCEVVLDEWPWLKPYIEVEGPSVPKIKAVAAKLGFDYKDALFGDVVVAYRLEYPGIGPNETIGTLPEIRFDLPLPDWLKERST